MQLNLSKKKERVYETSLYKSYFKMWFLMRYLISVFLCLSFVFETGASKRKITDFVLKKSEIEVACFMMLDKLYACRKKKLDTIPCNFGSIVKSPPLIVKYLTLSDLYFKGCIAEDSLKNLFKPTSKISRKKCLSFLDLDDVAKVLSRMEIARYLNRCNYTL